MSNQRREAQLWTLLADALGRGHTTTLLVHGSCMWPALRHGDRITVSALRRAPRVGDIVVYHPAARAVAHRIVEVSTAGGAGFVRTRGDAAALPDAPVAICDLVGVVDSIERGGCCVRPLARGTRVSRLLALLRASTTFHKLLRLARNWTVGTRA